MVHFLVNLVVILIEAFNWYRRRGAIADDIAELKRDFRRSPRFAPQAKFHLKLSHRRPVPER